MQFPRFSQFASSLGLAEAPLREAGAFACKNAGRDLIQSSVKLENRGMTHIRKSCTRGYRVKVTETRPGRCKGGPRNQVCPDELLSWLVYTGFVELHERNRALKLNGISSLSFCKKYTNLETVKDPARALLLVL